MPLIQGGPPEWIWERTANLLKWDVVELQTSNGHPRCELRLSCGLEIIRLQFFTEGEIEELRAAIDDWASGVSGHLQGEPVRPGREPGVSPEREPDNKPEVPEAEHPPQREEGVVSDPDSVPKR